MSKSDTLSSIGREFLIAAAPLKNAFSDKEKFKEFLYALGWDVTDLPPEYVSLATTVSSLESILEKFINDDVNSNDVLELLAGVKNLYSKIQNISSAPPGINASAFLGEIKDKLFEYLLTSYLQKECPRTYNFFSALGVIEIENTDATTDKHAHVRVKFKWDEIPAILRNPLSILKRTYGWGEVELNAGLLFEHLLGFLYGFKLPVAITGAPRSLISAYNNDLPLLSPMHRSLKIPFYYTSIDDKGIELSIEIVELQASGDKLPGIIIQPRIPSEIPLDINLTENVTMNIKASSDIGSTFGVIIRPDEISVKYPFSDSNFPTAGFEISFDQHPQEPLLLLGSQNGIRLQVKGFALSFKVSGSQDGLEAKASFEIKELALILSAGDSDGFLKKLLGDGETQINIPLAFDWSSKTGFGFRGSANFEIALYPHLDIGPISISEFQLALKIGDGDKSDLSIEAGINANANLGPIKIVVEEVGLGVYTKFENGNLGPLNIGLGFKPPAGVGLSIDAGAVSGGGFLRFDPDNGEYSGTFELTIVDLMSVKAIGLITTKMPDGSKGFSLLIILTAEFTPPFQLGFGFTLNGVGGLLGLNRTVLVDVLREGVRTGAVNNIMFPQNVIANALRILSDLKSIFPPYEGKFLIGPMAKLGWGSPTLITLSFGLIIEIPGNIAILGVLRIVLPDQDKVLVNVNVSFVGILDFNKELLSFDASLFESRILFLTLEGDMAVRLKWGNEPDFILTVGGFHPQYTPPPLALPTLRRITVNVLNSDNAKLRFELYQAITSNTVQFGCKAEMYFGFSSLSVEGNFSFDALFQFSPFMFIIDISGHVALKAFSVGVFTISFKLTLQGPTPWRAKGRGSISFFFFSISANFDKTWGETQDTSLPPVEIRTRLLDELRKPGQWQVSLDFGKKLFVSLRKLDDTETAMLMHPAGALVVTQKLMPLDLDIDKLGNQKISDIKSIGITHADSAGTELDIAPVTGPFAVAQYKDMSDSEKLSRASFERMHAGVSITMKNETIGAGMMTRRIVEYEEIIIDKEPQKPKVKGQLGGLFTHFLNGHTATKSVLSRSRQKKLQPFQDKIVFGEGNYTVAFTDNNNAFSTTATFSSEAMAVDYMGKLIKNNPTMEKRLHIIESYEINS